MLSAIPAALLPASAVAALGIFLLFICSALAVEVWLIEASVFALACLMAFLPCFLGLC